VSMLEQAVLIGQAQNMLEARWGTVGRAPVRGDYSSTLEPMTGTTVRSGHTHRTSA
jgi:hypothetical protein